MNVWGGGEPIKFIVTNMRKARITKNIMKNQITGKSLMFLYIFIHYKTAIIKAMLSFNWKDQQTV